ncbi:MAG: two pore domain potassium channel family protein [Chloroflexi bacterium]|nr:two pore domain potassium channel family protein [Chloroflexota bacterium]
MSDDTSEQRPVRTLKPGDRVLRVRTRRAKLPLIERRLEAPLVEAFRLFRDIATQTPILWFLFALLVLVIIGPVPVWLFERTAADPDMTSYWVGLWWAVSAFSTVGHSGVSVETAGGRIFGSIYTVLSVSLFFGSVIAAFSSYFILTWRTPKRQLVDTINYYLQRVEELSVEELEDLEDMTRGLLLTARERVESRSETAKTPPERP